MSLTKELKEWVKNVQKTGANDDSIKEALLKAGYDEKTAEEAVNKRKRTLWIAGGAIILAIILITLWIYTQSPTTTEGFNKELAPLLSKQRVEDCAELASKLPLEEQSKATDTCVEFMAAKYEKPELCSYSTNEAMCREKIATRTGELASCLNNGCEVKTKDRIAISERDASKCATEICTETIAILNSDSSQCTTEQCRAVIENNAENCHDECNRILAIIKGDESYCNGTESAQICSGIVSALTGENHCGEYKARALQECQERIEPPAGYERARREAYGISKEQYITAEVQSIIYQEKNSS